MKTNESLHDLAIKQLFEEQDKRRRHPVTRIKWLFHNVVRWLRGLVFRLWHADQIARWDNEE